MQIEAERENQRRNEQYCKYVMQQANEQVHMLTLLSKWTGNTFYHPEFKDRTASLLNHFLTQLCRPIALSLKVQNPEKFKFQPHDLLKQIILIYNNLH